MDWDWDREIAERGFLEAAKRGDAGRVLELINAGMDIDARDSIGWTALMAATAGRHVDLMADLLARGAGLDFINSFHYRR